MQTDGEATSGDPRPRAAPGRAKWRSLLSAAALPAVLAAATRRGQSAQPDAKKPP